MELNEKQIKILKTAEELFAEHGFDGTSVRLIAKAAGINIAMISYYFGSKEKLLEALLVYRLKYFRLQAEAIINTQSNYFEKLDAFIDLLIKRIHKNRRTYKIVNFEYSNGTRTIDFETYENYKKKNYQILEHFVLQGQKDGAFKTDVNIQLIIPSILGPYFHFYFNKLFYKNLLNLNTKEDVEYYVHNQLTKHIQQTIKALLTYEK
ncbi:TetR/AcrR family transcriptional regulator [Formosa sp. S-31]|uniref:TetR/AcrR family transcriptional regulator n=1 Tax=Formosa sp. S-31 TaxID=2790949 RepID=UPI003EBDC771